MDKIKPERTIHLSEYYFILLKHKSLIIASLVIMVTLTMLFSFLMKPVYRATATMVIEKEQSMSPLTGERMDYESYVSQSLTFNTHFKLITSQPVMEKVVKDLNLIQINRDKGLQSGFITGLFSQLKKNLKLLLGKKKKLPLPGEELAGIAENLRKKIDINEVRDTRLLKINVEDHDSVLATDLANALARVYIEYNISNRLKSSKSTLGWMSDHLYAVKKKLEDAEQEFLAYKEKEKIFSIKGKQNVNIKKIEEFNDAYLDTRNKRLELDAKLAKLKQIIQPDGDIFHARSIIDNALIENLSTQLLDAEVEIIRLSKVFKSKHPKIVQLTSKIENTKTKLKEEIKKEVENLKVERSVLLSKEKILQKTMADFENDALHINRKELKYTILERNMHTNQKLYDTLLTKIKEADIVDDMDVSNIRIAEEASVPTAPVKPKKKLNLILSIIFGLMTGVGLSFFIEYIDRTLRTEEDVARYLDLPVLSVIPVADPEKPKVLVPRTGKLNPDVAKGEDAADPRRQR